MSPKPAPPAGKPRWKLWHLAVVVLAIAPPFAAIHDLDRGRAGPIGDLSALVLVTIALTAPFVLLGVVLKLARRATSGLESWGIRRGGVVGFLARAAGIWAGAAASLVALAIGPVAAVALLMWLARLVGR